MKVARNVRVVSVRSRDGRREAIVLMAIVLRAGMGNVRSGPAKRAMHARRAGIGPRGIAPAPANRVKVVSRGVRPAATDPLAIGHQGGIALKASVPSAPARMVHPAASARLTIALRAQIAPMATDRHGEIDPMVIVRPGATNLSATVRQGGIGQKAKSRSVQGRAPTDRVAADRDAVDRAPVDLVVAANPEGSAASRAVAGHAVVRVAESKSRCGLSVENSAGGA